MDGAKNERIAWIGEEIVPKIVKVLGKDCDHLECKISTPNNALFMSNVYFLDMIFCEQDECTKFSLVLKMPPASKKLRDFINIDQLFHNEILFYSSFAKSDDDFPKCIFTMEEPPEKAVIVVENITKHGYDLCSAKFDLPMKYVLSAVQEIGRFHGKGYILKERRTKEFFDIVNGTQEYKYAKFEGNPLVEFLKNIAQRPVTYLRTQNYDRGVCDKFEALFRDMFDNVFYDPVVPEEPLAVLCHGDFTRNNVMFKEVGEHIQPRLIDFAQMRYGSPALDISTFVYLSCDCEQRKEHFPTIFKAYHDALVAYLTEEGIVDLERYSLSAFQADYKRHAIFGYMIAIFYLPVMCIENLSGPQEIVEQDLKATTEMMGKFGGENMSKKIADMLLELKDTGCLDHLM